MILFSTLHPGISAFFFHLYVLLSISWFNILSQFLSNSKVFIAKLPIAEILHMFEQGYM